ncbi:ABC transporter ATP-binding protein [Spiractinospora alimapuensis]|uniref:energy-coupling factor ABC transporter ATP-binding protein n=1 Tax=Spiractinospora alimapuensis TaxID=2820884 RepID=UPI001F3FB769|nr:ABC transporter ATP-binding protein [Spiractinospora alimapuensis]QVQ54794.1 ABC transporter ATP-binding protein [Spiractinospora alimapuensis]
MIELSNVSHSYDDRPVLRDVSLRLTERRVGIIGANGSGKSTLARTLNGLVVPDSGRVSVDGLDTRRDPRSIRRRVGFIFADADAQILMPTVAEDVAIGLRDRGRTAAETATMVEETLRRWGLWAHRDHPAHLLSSGQKQLLALASVLATEPSVLVCDEPTTLLDLRNLHRLRRALRALPQRVLLLTHHLDMLTEFDRVLVMDEGRVVFDGRPEPAVAFYQELMGSDE